MAGLRRPYKCPKYSVVGRLRVLRDSLCRQLSYHIVQIGRVGVSVTWTVTVELCFVMDLIPDDAVGTSCRDGSADGKDQTSLPSGDQQGQDLVRETRNLLIHHLLTHWPLGNLNEILDVIFKQILVIYGWGISCEIAPIWMSLDFTDDQSTLVQVMAWCCQATSHHLSQCWPRSLSPYGVTRPQCVNILRPEQNACHFDDIAGRIFFN